MDGVDGRRRSTDGYREQLVVVTATVLATSSLLMRSPAGPVPGGHERLVDAGLVHRRDQVRRHADRPRPPQQWLELNPAP